MRVLLPWIVEGGEDQCPAPGCGPGPPPGEMSRTGTRLIRDERLPDTRPTAGPYASRRGAARAVASPAGAGRGRRGAGGKGCESTPNDVLMFSMSEGASLKGPETEDTPNARVAE
ncbi:hypothetical protein GCM10010206_20010 [Streptomyces cinerochromogenes]|nr:hypothetical protein GCM10010206_20010 [Streptomyces cinerochromogenes]